MNLKGRFVQANDPSAKLDHEYDALSQDTEIVLIDRLVCFLNCKYFIDVGAEKGTFSKIMLGHGMAGVVFEPLPKHFAILNDLVKRYPKAALRTCAITNVDTKQFFNVATDDEGRELDYYHSLQKASAPGIFSHNKSFEVECRSLKSLAERGEIAQEIGVLKTDTEGNDLNVLRGLGLLRPEIVVCEYFSPGLYNGWAEGAPELAIEHMHGLGYEKFLATKRIGALEFLGTSPTLFQDKQWGNLLFFRNDFYKKAESTILKAILEKEIDISRQFAKMDFDLREKEKVIQQLLCERQLAAANVAQRPVQ